MSLSDFTIFSVVALHFFEMIRSEVRFVGIPGLSVREQYDGCWSDVCSNRKVPGDYLQQAGALSLAREPIICVRPYDFVKRTPTLSPGELQRLRLATQVRSNLFGVVYVLHEPSAGLHPADTEALLRALEP
jgi:hypothetical protein